MIQVMIHALLVVTLLGVSKPLYAVEPAAESFKPILDLDAEAETIPFLDLVLRDPIIDLRAANAVEAEMLLNSVSDLEEKFESVKAKKQRLKLLNDIFRHYLAIVTYIEDVDYDLIEDKRVARLDIMRAKLLKYATILASVAKDPEEKARGRYHVLAAKLLAGKWSDVLATLESETSINGRHKFNIEFVRAIGELSNSSDQEAGRARLTKLFPNLSAPAGTVAMLLIARSFAGLDDKGGTFAEANPEYRKYLIAATKRAAYMPELMRMDVLSFSLAVWRSAEGGQEDWSKPAIAVASFKGLDELHAVEERLALRAVAKGALTEAIQRYAKVIEAHQRVPELAPLTERLLDLQAMLADRTNGIKAYGDALRAAEKKFSSKEVLGKDHVKTAQAFGQKFHERYRGYVLAQLERGLDTQTPPALRAAALDLTRDYIDRSRKADEKTEFAVKMAQVHTVGGAHGKAAEIYSELSERNKGAESVKFLRMAIEAQSVVAKWPIVASWDAIPRGDAKARMVLAGMYEELNQSTRSQDWAVLAHIGLLHVSVGRDSEAYAIWLGALKGSQHSEEVSRAAGWLLTSARQKKKWGDMVYVANFVQTRNIVPISGTRDLDPAKELADGYYNGGKAAYGRGEHAVAAKFLRSFVEQNVRDPRYVDALYHRAKAQVSLEDWQGATTGLRELLVQFPKSKFQRDVVLSGLKAARTDDDRILFGEAYLKTVPNGERTPEIRGMLAGLHLKIANYEAASRLLDAQAKDSRVTPAERYDAYHAVMAIEEKHGSLAKARKAAAALAALAKGNQAQTARVIAFSARDTVRLKRADKLEGMEKQLLAFDSGDTEVIEALAQVRLLIAIREADKPLPRVDPLTVKDPIQVVQSQVTIYQNLRRSFDRVCELSVAEYCLAAKQNLSEMSRRSIDMIRSIPASVTMDDKASSSFQTRKQQIIEIMSQTVVGQDQLMGRN